MKAYLTTLLACMLLCPALTFASPDTDKAAFEQAAKQDILQRNAKLQFRALLVTEFDDSLNLCGELQAADAETWSRFIKIFDKDKQHFEAVWIEPADSAYEVEEFKRSQFESYWDRRCSSIR